MAAAVIDFSFILLVFLQILAVTSYSLLREVGSPAAEFISHEVTKVYVLQGRYKREICTEIKDVHLQELTIGFDAFGKHFLVELQMNRELFPSKYVEHHHHQGKTIISKPYQKNISHCYYKGRIKDVPHSWVALSTCTGISGVLYDGQEMIYIEPVNDDQKTSHFVYRSSNLKPLNFSCGYVGSSPFSFYDSPKSKRMKRAPEIRGPYNSNRQSRYVELVLVNDNKEFLGMNGDREKVVARSKEIANIVNALYTPLNIFIALVGVVVWSEFDQITLSSDGDTTLTNFLHYRRERLVSEIPNDNAQLITGIAFDGGVVGKALKGPICTYEYSGGVNMDHSPMVALVATTVAHELGHNFGMEHDNDECSCPEDRCIMAPSSSSTSPTHWSSCSLDYLHLAFEHGMDYCLRNRPFNLIGPVCGNGFVEEGEQCDCGLKKFCNNPCCDANTCLLFANASCATGECCDLTTCQPKSPATVCRAAAGECDLPEYCDGKKEFCPIDVYKQDGASCKNDKAYCYNGNCRSHGDQCKLLWGQSGQMSDFRCFDQNKKGTASGNCGYYRLNQTYRACDKEDILCGMLHCTHLNERLEFGMESVAILSRSFITTGGKLLTCRSAIVDLGLNSIDPGLAPDGAKCGENKVCVNQRCMAVGSLRNNYCPYNCNKKGICNSRGNCHCDVGFAPPYCDSPGAGGSEDSGPASDPLAKDYVAAAFYILLLGIVPFVVLISCFVYYYRGHLKTWWLQKAREAAIKSRAKEASNRKKQTKYSVDRNSFRNLEISAPLQPDLLLPVTSVKSQNSTTCTTPVISTASRSFSSASYSQENSGKSTRIDRNSLRNLEISAPIPQSEIVAGGRLMPVRPAPPCPNSVLMRTTNNVDNCRVHIEHGSVRLKRLSGPRPTSPPPRPPPPRVPPSAPPLQQDTSGNIYEMPIYSECLPKKLNTDDSERVYATPDSKGRMNTVNNCDHPKTSIVASLVKSYEQHNHSHNKNNNTKLASSSLRQSKPPLAPKPTQSTLDSKS